MKAILPSEHWLEIFLSISLVSKHNSLLYSLFLFSLDDETQANLMLRSGKQVHCWNKTIVEVYRDDREDVIDKCSVELFEFFGYNKLFLLQGCPICLL